MKIEWDLGGAVRDSIWIAGTADDETLNTAWEFEHDSTWVAYPDNWSNPADESNPLDVTLWIFPYVSTSAIGCAALPVQLLSFNAEQRNTDVVLNWQVSSELNMKGYEIERANNDGVFKTISFVQAINNDKNQNYTITDKNAFTNTSTIQYRLKQIDGDGSVKYSRIITIKSTAVIANVIFPNPFTGTLRIQFNLLSTQSFSVKMYDLQGRLVAFENPSLSNASSNIFYMKSTANLPAGSYLLELNAGIERLVYKVVKQ